MDTGKISKLLKSYIHSFGKRKLKRSPAPEIPEAVFDYIKDSSSEYFTIGFGKAEILPPDILKKKYYVAGYGNNNPAQGVLDAPGAHVILIDDNTGRGCVAFISIDAIGILNSDVNFIRNHVKDFTDKIGCRSVNILSTHDHAAIDTMGVWGHLPRSGKDPKYIKFIAGRVKEALQAAHADRREGSLYYGTIEVPDMQEDIRTPIVYSKTLTRFRFVPNDSSREIYFLNFASHSESLQGCNSRVSADFPEYLRREIREKSGAETVYCVGSIGGMISMEIPNEREIRDTTNDFAENTEKIGRKLAGYALSVSNEKKLSPLVNFIRQEFYCEVDNSVLAIAQKINILAAKPYPVKWASNFLAVKTEMSYFEIGGIKMALLPGELFPELVFGGYLSAEESGTGLGAEVNPTPLTQIAGEEELLVFGLANDELGYILPPNDFMLDPAAPYLEEPRDKHGRKHYEETFSLGPNTAPKIAEVFTKIMQQVNEVKSK